LDLLGVRFHAYSPPLALQCSLSECPRPSASRFQCSPSTPLLLPSSVPHALLYLVHLPHPLRMRPERTAPSRVRALARRWTRSERWH
jgi:hypothetical protein